MKKKVMVLAALLAAVIGAESAFGFAIGGAFGFAGGAPGAMVSIRPTKSPVLFGVTASFQNPASLGLTADWWLYQTSLAGPLSLYIGPGAYLSVANSSLALGARIPIGLQLFPLKPLELFVEVAPTIGIVPTFGAFGYQAALGFRFWF